MNYNTVSFPGLGIGEFTIDPTAFKITDNITIEWYAIIICVGILLAFFACDRLAKRFGVVSDHILDVLLISLPAGFVGARVWYILGDLDSFDSFMDMIAVWNGGLAIYGGIFGGCLAAYFVCRFKKISFLNMLDLAAIGFMIGQCVGRWGNFTNGEAFGGETDWFCRMGLNNSLTHHKTLFVHPTFLYESLWNLIGFIIANIIFKKRQYDGQIFLFIFAWYGFGRMFIEGLRTDSLYGSFFGIQFRVSQVLAALIFAACLFFIIYFAVKKPKKQLYYYNVKKAEKRK